MKTILFRVLSTGALLGALGGSAFAANTISAAHRHHQVKLHGKWSNPVGACVAHIVTLDPATGDLKCTGTSKWTGTWTGSTTWTLTGNQDPATAVVTGRIDEVFTGRAHKGHKKSRKGKLTFVEHLTIDPDGKIEIRGHITKGSGGLAGSTGHASWTGTTLADGSGHGPYKGRWRQGEGHH